MAWALAINNISNEEFPVKSLEDQQKSPCCIYYMISKIISLDHCVKMSILLIGPDEVESNSNQGCNRYTIENIQWTECFYV